jgi:hypothetical protein
MGMPLFKLVLSIDRLSERYLRFSHLKSTIVNCFAYVCRALDHCQSPLRIAKGACVIHRPRARSFKILRTVRNHRLLQLHKLQSIREQKNGPAAAN